MDGGGVEGEETEAGDDKKPVESKLDARLQVCVIITPPTHPHPHSITSIA